MPIFFPNLEVYWVSPLAKVNHVQGWGSHTAAGLKIVQRALPGGIAWGHCLQKDDIPKWRCLMPLYLDFGIDLQGWSMSRIGYVQRHFRVFDGESIYMFSSRTLTNPWDLLMKYPIHPDILFPTTMSLVWTLSSCEHPWAISLNDAFAW